MIAYRVEIWCNKDGCLAGMRKGTVHNELDAMPGLGGNLVGIRAKEG